MYLFANLYWQPMDGDAEGGLFKYEFGTITYNIQQYIDKGLSPQKAAIIGTQEIWKPVTTSVLTTIAAFMPLMMMFRDKKPLKSLD